MHDPAIVGGREAARQLPRPFERFSRRHGATVEPLAKRLAFEQLHDGMRDAVGGADVVERKDVGMVDRRNRARFALEACERVRVGGESTRQNLDGDVAAEPRVVGSVHLSHAAGANRRDNLVRAEARANEAGSWGHGQIIAPGSAVTGHPGPGLET